MYIITKNYRTEKPPAGSSLNFGHPLAQGLVGAWLLNEGGGKKLIDIARKNNGSLLGGYNWNGDKIFFGGVDGYIDLDKTITFTNQFSITLVYGITTLTGATIDSNMPIGGNDTINYVQSQVTANDWRVVINGTLTDFSWTKPVYLIGEYVLTITRNKSNITTAYINSIPSDTGGVSKAGNFLIDYIGKGYNNTNYTWYGNIKRCYIHNRSLQPSEIQSLYEAPYQMVQPIRRRFISVGGGGTPPIPPGAVGGSRGSFLTLGCG